MRSNPAADPCDALPTDIIHDAAAEIENNFERWKEEARREPWHSMSDYVHYKIKTCLEEMVRDVRASDA